MTLKRVETFLCVEILKWKRNNNNQNVNKFSIKMSKIMLALMTLSADKEDFVIRFNIFMFIIYVEAIKDSIWKQM